MHLLALWFYFISVLACSYALIWKYCVVPILQTHIDNFRVEESKHAFYFRQRLWVPYWKKVFITLFSLQYHTDWEAYDKFHAQVEEAITREVEKRKEKMSQQSKMQDYTATETAPITPGHTLPKDLLLAKAQAYRTATAGNESVLPQVSDLYQAHFLKRALGKFHENMPTYVRTGELAVGKVYGDGTGILEVPVVPHNTEQIVDYRLKEKERKKGQQVMVAAVEIQADGFASNSSTTTMAAALFDKRHSLVANSFKGSFASAASGVPTHVVFYPSLRIAPGDDPNEVLTLSTVSRDTDFDDNYTLAEFTARTVYVKARGPDKIRETKNLIFSSNLDRVKAHQFADETRCVVSTPRVNPAVDLTNYKMPTPFGNLVRTEGIYSADGSILFPKARKGHNPEIVLNYTGAIGKSSSSAKEVREAEWRKNSRNTIHDYSESEDDMDSYEGQATMSSSSARKTIPLGVLQTELFQSLLDPEVAQEHCEAQLEEQDQVAFGQALMEQEVLEVEVINKPLLDMPETMRLLTSGFGSLPLNCVQGHKILTVYLNKLGSLAGVHTQLLQMYARIPGSIRLRFHCELPPTCGIGLCAAYVEGNENASLGTVVGRLVGPQQKRWNPALESVIDFEFKPFSCVDYWNMHMLGNATLAPAITVLCLSGWLGSPKVAPNFSYAMYFEPTSMIPKQIATMEHVPSSMMRKEIGTLKFEQGVRKCYAFEANIGKCQVEGKVVTRNFASIYCGLFQYIETDIILDILIMSSPMLGATFTIAYVSGNHLSSVINQQHLDSLPHVNFTFKKSLSSVLSLRFPKEIFPSYLPLDQWNLSVPSVQDSAGYFVLFQRDLVTSQQEGALGMRISMRCGTNMQFHGLSAGYPAVDSRNGKTKDKKKKPLPQVREIVQRQKGQGPQIPLGDTFMYHQMASWEYKKHKYPGERTKLQLLTVNLKLRLDGTRNSEDLTILHSPVTNFLQGCAWIRGTIYWKVEIQASSDFRASDRCASNSIFIHENSLKSNTSHTAVSTTPNSTHEFSRKIVGPVDGFKPMAWHIGGDKKFYKMNIRLGNVHEVESVRLFCRFGSDMEFGGQQKATHYTLAEEVEVFKEIDLK